MARRILMDTRLTKTELIKFEEDVKAAFLAKKILSPVHLSRGNENQLLEIFKEINAEDWVFSTHRNHYHALLKGIPADRLRKEILEGRSMHLSSREHRFFSSSMVGGCLPIALGVAMGIKWKGEKRHCWVFAGDMAAESGAFHECTKYASRHELPITFVVEDNELSTETPTQLVWGTSKGKPHIIRYRYVRGMPHVGIGKWVTF